jgi:SAM-dependent methyltransferase
MPHIEFRACSLQQFDDPTGFDVVTSITVLQHAPHIEQEKMVVKIRELLRPGGHVIILENASHQAPHVFSRRPKDWERLFEQAGFVCRRVCPYDYSPALRAVGGVTRALARIGSSRTDLSLTAMEPQCRAQTLPSLRHFHRLLYRLAVMIDEKLEMRLVAARLPLPTVHCGFLFAAV